MARSAVQELDFFSMEKKSSTHTPKLYPAPRLETGITIGGVDSVISDTGREVLKSAISTGSGNAVAAAAKGTSVLDPSTARADYPLLPVFNPTSRLCCGSENDTEIAPLTIFYGGTVAVFGVSSEKAEDILKFAERSKIMDAFSSNKQPFVEKLMGDLPLARRNSLLRFLEKRKERLTRVSPYGLPPFLSMAP